MVNLNPVTLEISVMARTATKVDENLFRSAVANAEKNGALKNLGVLYGAIVKQYTILTIENNELPPISAAVAKERLSTWQIEVKTDPGRKPKSNLFAIKIAGILAGIACIKGEVPADMAEIHELLDELVGIVNEPLEPAETTVSETETAEETVEVIVPSAEVAAEVIALSEVSDANLAA